MAGGMFGSIGPTRVNLDAFNQAILQRRQLQAEMERAAMDANLRALGLRQQAASDAANRRDSQQARAQQMLLAQQEMGLRQTEGAAERATRESIAGASEAGADRRQQTGIAAEMAAADAARNWQSGESAIGRQHQSEMAERADQRQIGRDERGYQHAESMFERGQAAQEKARMEEREFQRAMQAAGFQHDMGMLERRQSEENAKSRERYMENEEAMLLGAYSELKQAADPQDRRHAEEIGKILESIYTYRSGAGGVSQPTLRQALTAIAQAQAIARQREKSDFAQRLDMEFDRWLRQQNAMRDMMPR